MRSNVNNFATTFLQILNFLFEIAMALGVKYETLNKHLKAVGIQYEGNPCRKGIPHYSERKPINEYLNEIKKKNLNT